jgi:hypothetical protein
MPPDPTIADELARFKLDGQVLKDAVAISDELSAGPDSAAVMKGLTLLDERLAARSKLDPKRAMGTVLLASEGQWGVNVDSGNAVRVTALSFLPAGAFAGQLKSATLIKDPGAGGDHGEYTHRIQWFIVHEMKLAADANALLRHTGAPEMLPAKDQLNGLWDCLFDRLRRSQFGLKAYLATGKTDFRSPEHFNLWLKDQVKVFPSLALYLQKRFDKRQPEKNFEHYGALSEWIKTHPDSGCSEFFRKQQKLDNLEAAFNGVLYALKKAKVAVDKATEPEMTKAIEAFEAGLLRR